MMLLNLRQGASQQRCAGEWTRTLSRRSCLASRLCPGILSLLLIIRDKYIISWMRSGRLIAEMRGGVDEDTEPQELSSKQVVALHQLLHEAKFKDPDKDHLSPAGELAPYQKIMKRRWHRTCEHSSLQAHLPAPRTSAHPHDGPIPSVSTSKSRQQATVCTAGEYNLRLGIVKELHPEIIATHQGKLLASCSLAERPLSCQAYSTSSI